MFFLFFFKIKIKYNNKFRILILGIIKKSVGYAIIVLKSVIVNNVKKNKKNYKSLVCDLKVYKDKVVAVVINKKHKNKIIK
jgi:hypothetical protein